MVQFLKDRNTNGMKTATTVEEQLHKMQERGLIINDLSKAREILSDIGYFRLGFYCFPFEKNYPEKHDRTHLFMENVSFEDVVKLYYFDTDLRYLLSRYINRIEINFRSAVSYIVSNQYKKSPTWFVDKNVVASGYAEEFPSRVYTESFKKSSTVIKEHHRKHINDRYAPAWKTIEFMTFGAVIKLYEAIKDDKIKEKIAQRYQIENVAVFRNYMQTICSIRNICAHGAVLFDLSLPRSVKRGPSGKMSSQTRHSLNGVLAVILYMMEQISRNRADELRKALSELFTTAMNVPAIAVVLRDRVRLVDTFLRELLAFD
jgi:hypothetical protein